jgi:hypothetical protein
VQKLDTVNIYKNKCGVSFKTYKRTLFPRSGSFSYSLADLNKQDSIVILESKNKTYYLKVFDTNNNLLFEGQKSATIHGMNGDVKYYRKDKTIKRIETWSSFNSSTTDSVEVFASDSPSVITTKYFSNKGTKTKQIETIVDIYSTSPLKYCIVKRVLKFNKHGDFKTRDRKMSCEK